MSWALTSILATLLWAICFLPASAQGTVCGDRDEIAARLLSQFGEIRAAGGPVTGGGVFAVWVNPQTLTWTVTVASEDRICVIGSGTDFEVTKAPAH